MSAAASSGAMPAMPGMAEGALSSTAGKSTADVALRLEALLGQHSVLVADMMRSRIRNDEDFAQVAADALNRITDDLAAATGTLFGPAAGQQFLALWADHIDALVGCTAGVAAHDDARRQAALDKLRDFEGRLAAFLDAATGKTIPTADLAKALLAHDQMLTRQVDATASKDYPQAHELAYNADQDMFGLARQLSDAFGETVAAKLPQGGAETGAGGTAGVSGPR